MKNLLIKAEEFKKLQDYLDEIPHKYGKQIEFFFVQVQANREKEQELIDAQKDKPDPIKGD